MKKLSNICESVWGDMRKRAEGGTFRKEDDINSLSQDELFSFLNDHYTTIRYNIDNDHKPIDKENAISVPFVVPYQISNHGYSVSLEFKKKGKIVTINSELKDEIPNVYDKICDAYIVKPYTRYLSTLTPLGSDENETLEIDNKFYVNLIEYLIDNVEDRIRIINRK